MTGHPALIAYLESLIAERGPIPFSTFMDAALYHPEYGYYSRSAHRIGPQGDFVTAADFDPALGQLLAKLFSEMSERVDDFSVVELGAGTGLLARHILERHPFSYAIVERSPAMRERQQETLSGFGVRWHRELPTGVTGCIFSNEFFDALPVRRFIRREGRLRELFVGPGIQPVEGDPEILLDLPLLDEGAIADVSLAAREWVQAIARSLERGYHLTIDYGYLDRELFARASGTLMCYRDHRADSDPYDAVGLKDMTAHVNFSDLIEVGRNVGLIQVGFRSQREFLVGLGLLEWLAPLAERGDAESIRRLQALKNLFLPPMMGDRFKVLLQRKGVRSTPLPSFPVAGS